MKRMAVQVLAIVLALLFIFPLVWMIIVSLKPDGVNVYTLADWLRVSDLHFGHYRKVIKDSQILRWTWNSAVIGVLTTVLS
ncbi:carbohydrate ABC transporter permease, partial [Paenibacillus whitsoniae]